MFQQISAKNSSAYWVNISQKRISFINCSTVIMSRLVISLPNFKSMNNSHNKNILNEQEKPSPCNFRNKTSCLLEGICQHKNLVLYFLVKFQSQIPDLKKTIRSTLDLQNIGSTNITILLTTSQKETQQNFLVSYGVKRKRRSMWILIGAS